MTTIFFPKPDKNKTKKLLKHGRAYMRRLIECTTGHNNLNYLIAKQNIPWGCLGTMQILWRRTRNIWPLTKWMPMLPTSPLWYSTKPTYHQLTKVELGRYNSLLAYTSHWWSYDLWVVMTQTIPVGPGMGGTPLPLTLGTRTQSTVGMPLCLSYREGWMSTLLEEWETGTS